MAAFRKPMQEDERLKHWCASHKPMQGERGGSGEVVSESVPGSPELVEWV